MRCYQDVFNKDIPMSDMFPFHLEYEEAIMKVQSSFKSANKIGLSSYCPNEMGEEEGEEEMASEKVIDVVAAAGLQLHRMPLNEFLAYIKNYLARIVKYFEANEMTERVSALKKEASAFVKFIITIFDEVDIYCGASKTDEDFLTGSLVISYMEDETAEGPMFYFFKDGLKEVKA